MTDVLCPYTPVTIDRTRTEFPTIGAAWRARALRINDRLGLRALASVADDPQPATSGPLAGVPVLVKDTIDTADLATTAGSLVMPETPPAQDAWIVSTLRHAGATIAAKTTCSEWANFRGEGSISGWNARYGLARNPYDPTRSTGGSSSGSAAAVAAGIAPIAIGTETDGSMLCPASLNGVIGFKFAATRLDRTGVIPISSTQDSLGIFAASADDLLTVASVLGVEASGLSEPIRLCVVEAALNGFHPRTLARFRDAMNLLERAGVDVVTLSTPPRGTLEPSDDDELLVLRTELSVQLNAYLARRAIPGLSTLADVVAANEDLADRELVYFGQEHFVAALESDPTDPAYRSARQRNLERTTEAIESTLEAAGALAILAPTMDVAWPIDLLRGDPSAPAGYRAAAVAGATSVSVPAGRIGHLPVGVCLSAPAGEEGTLLELTALLDRALAPLAGLAGRESAAPLLSEA